MANEEFISALRQIAAERKIEIEDILEGISEAVMTSYIKDKDIPKENLEVSIDPNDGNITVFLIKEVVKSVVDPELEIQLEAAKLLYPNTKLGARLKFDITPEGDFGRIAAQTARQVIRQKIKEAERDAALAVIKDRVGSIINVQVEKVGTNGEIICEYSGVRAILPKEERIFNEYYRIGMQIKVALIQIVEEIGGNKYLDVARGSEKFLRAVFELEVPEVSSGTVELAAIAREAGSRTKVAVRSTSPGIDPRGSCIGQRGMRINAILDAIKSGATDEKVDIIEWSEDPTIFLANSIQPAEAKKVELVDEKKKLARITVDDDKLSLAIGKDGQNARLAKKLTGWDIELVTDSGEKVKTTD